MLSPWTRTFDSLYPFEDMLRSLSRLVDDMNAPASSRVAHSSALPFHYELRDDGEQITVRTDVPGLSSEQLALSATEEALTIRAERSVTPREGYRLLRSERGSGAFIQTVQMPCKIDVDGVDASLDAGVLTVTLRKHAAERPRTIAIKTKEG